MTKKISAQEKRITQKQYETLAPINSQLGKKMVVYRFTFLDGSRRVLKGYNRGLGPIGGDLKDWEEPIGIWTDRGDYYYFVIDNRESQKLKIPTFKIGENRYYYQIVRCYEMAGKLDPKTGNGLRKK